VSICWKSAPVFCIRSISGHFPRLSFSNLNQSDSSGQGPRFHSGINFVQALRQPCAQG
jgi:hypothetical protein